MPRLRRPLRELHPARALRVVHVAVARRTNQKPADRVNFPQAEALRLFLPALESGPRVHEVLTIVEKLPAHEYRKALTHRGDKFSRRPVVRSFLRNHLDDDGAML